MSQDVRFIEITFENIDYIRIPAHYFRDFELAEVHTIVRRATANAILRYQKASSVTLELIGEADLEAANFDGDVFGLKEGETSLFKRLQRNDITKIKLIYSDKTEEEFSVAWEDADRGGYTNLLQSSTVDDAGTICVRIAGETK